MQWNHRILATLFVTTAACAQGPQTRQGQTPVEPPPFQKIEFPKNVRLAQAQMMDVDGAEAGTLNFEQMPNSMLVTFNFEGLMPRNTYRLYLYDGQSCGSLDAESGVGLSRLRADPEGIAEGSFKSERFALTGSRSILGRAVELRTAPKKPSTEEPVPVACGQILPRQVSRPEAPSDDSFENPE